MTILVRFANYAQSTLVAGLTASTTSLTVTSAASFPVPAGGTYFYATLVDQASVQAGLNPPNQREIVKVTAIAGNTMTIVRGQDGTTGQIWNVGDYVMNRINAQALQDIING